MGPKNLGAMVPTDLVAGASTLKLCLFPERITMSNLVILGQTAWTYNDFYIWGPKNLGALGPSP